MSSTPPELLTCATDLLQIASSEAQYRTVCSRAYYAAYHAAYDFHKKLPIPGSVGRANGQHEQLIEQLANPQIPSTHSKYKTSLALGKTMRGLLANRVTADYKINATVDRIMAVSETTDAGMVIIKAV